MPDQFKDSQDTSDSNQAHDLARFADDVEFRQVIKHKGENVGQDGEQINQVEGLNEKDQFAWSTSESNDVFDGKVDGREGVNPDNGVIDHAPAIVVCAIAAALGGCCSGGGSSCTRSSS